MEKEFFPYQGHYVSEKEFCFPYQGHCVSEAPQRLSACCWPPIWLVDTSRSSPVSRHHHPGCQTAGPSLPAPSIGEIKNFIFHRCE